MQIPKVFDRLFLFALLALAVAGVLLLAYATPRGLGLVNDSVSYVQGARGLLTGEGYSRPSGDGGSKPITHFPPLYSILLAGFGLFGRDAIPAARVANLALFGVNIALVGLVARRVLTQEPDQTRRVGAELVSAQIRRSEHATRAGIKPAPTRESAPTVSAQIRRSEHATRAGIKPAPTRESGRAVSAQIWRSEHATRAGIKPAPTRESGRAVFALLAAALFVASEALLRVHTFALSEPLFLALSLAGILCLLAALETGGARWIVAAGALAGLSYLTRSGGAALLAAGALLLVIQNGNGRGLRRALMYILAALPFVLGWSLRNWLLTGSATNRDVSVHPIAASELLEGLKNAWAFLLPGRLGLYERFSPWVWGALLGLGLVGLAALAVFLLRRRAFAPLLVLLHALGYLALVVVSMTTMDASTIFEDRILAPLYVDLLLLAAAGLLWLFGRGRGWRIAAAALALGLLLAFVDDTRRALPELRLDAQGFASSFWSNSELVQAARRLPQVTIYTNRLAGLNLLTGRPMYALLSPIDPVSQQPRAGYDQAVAAIRKAVQDGRAALVVFSAQKLLTDPESAWFAQLVAGLPVYAQYDDGMIYGAFSGSP